VYVVWEITMRCDHACAHCGSRAGEPRPDELSDAELMDVCDQIGAAGAREVTLIGGEAYLHPALDAIVRRLRGHGLRVTLQTGGLGLTEKTCARLKAAGVHAVGVSVDGDEAAHDTLRDRPGSHAGALRALERARAAGLVTTANTQVNTLSAGVLPQTAALLRARGARVWRCQLTVPMGRAADRPGWILPPWRVPEVLHTLAGLQVDAAREARAQGLDPAQIFNVTIGNNLGYYGPHEGLLRSAPGQPLRHWQGCFAGQGTLGIESDGTLKACPSLPTAPYQAGTLREWTLAQAWAEAPALRFTRDRQLDELWGFCATCAYREPCRAGCSFTAHCTLGRRGNNPFCDHRVRSLRARGLRERLVPAQAAPGAPYDFGRFELVEEPWPPGEDPAWATDDPYSAPAP
jgi:radical SAM protein with 4Fe4S-binding SPASM domain